MSKYNCPRCEYSTNQITHFKNHLKRKKICKSTLEDISIEHICFIYDFDISTILPQNTTILPQKSTILPQNTTILPKYDQNEKNINNSLKCSYCNKILSRNDSLLRHLKICNIKKENDEKKEKESQQLCLMKNEIINLKEELDKTKMVITNNKINNKISNNNSNNTQNINIHINNLGEENIKHIDYNFYNNILKGIYGAVPKLVEKIHFDKEHPENQNIKLTNKKEPYIKIRKNNKWKLADRKTEVLDLIDSKCFLLSEKYKKLLEKNNNLTDEQKDKIETFIEKYNEDNKVLIDDLMNKTELMLLNNSK